MHYYQFNIGDYASHTRHLTVIEDIAYRRLLDAYYLQERPFNASVSSVARQINMREHEPDVKTILEEFFILCEDGWRNERADKEIDKFHDKSKKASDAGKASAEQRKNKRSTDVEQTFNQPITINQEPITKNQEKKHPPSTKSVSITFKQFLDQCEQSGEKRIPETDAVFRYADKVGIPTEMIKVCWNKFAGEYMTKKKRYIDWRQTFRNCVESNWYKLWFVEADGTVKETSQYRALKKGLDNV